MFGITESMESAKGGELRLSIPFVGELTLIETTNETPKDKTGKEWDTKHPIQIKFKTSNGETYTYTESLPKQDADFNEKVEKTFKRIKLFLEVFFPEKDGKINIISQKPTPEEAWEDIGNQVVKALNIKKGKTCYGKIVGTVSNGKPYLGMPKYGGFVSTKSLSFSSKELTENAAYLKAYQEAAQARPDVSSSSSADSSLADLPTGGNSSSNSEENDLPF